MMDRQKKAKGRGQPGLPPLAPQAAMALQEQVARVAAALEAGQEPSAVQEMLQGGPPDPAWDLHLMAALANLAHPAIPTLLAGAFGTARDKARRKALKRALHLLKTRGVPVPPALLPREEVTLGSARGAAAALVSPVLGNGDSYVVLEGSPEILGGNFLVSRLNDREGFRECHLLTLKRRQQEEFWDHFRQQGLVQWFPVPSPYAVGLLEETYRLNPQAELGASRYAALRDRIFKTWGRPEDAPDLEQLLPQISPPEASRLLEQSIELALDPLFHSWLPALEEITPWFDKLKDVQQSPLILSEPQRQVRQEAVVAEATRALFPQESWPDWSRRLRRMAYYLDLLGRRQQARPILAAAANLAAERSPLTGENPFLQGLVHCSLRLAWETLEQPQETAPATGLVAPPTEPLIIRR
jgi:hypothetical protein